MRTRALDPLTAPLAVGALVLMASSCAARRTFTVTSEPPGAVLRIDDRVVGRTPYEENFDAYGKRRITLYKEGYHTLSMLVDIDAPWYGVFPLDLFSEVLLPVGWKDPHPIHVVLEPESGGVSAPDLDKVPSDLITHHINAIQAIVRDRTKLDTVSMAGELSRQLRGVADTYLTHANRDRPEHLEAIRAPSIAPAD